MDTTRRGALAGLGAIGAMAAWPRAALAQAAWSPTKPIKLVVAYPAGGPTDVIARLVAQEISGPLGQNVVVENVGGAAGALGTRQVAKAEPDGHTITFGNNQTHGNNMFMLKDPGYDAVKDFAPLAGVGAFEHVFVTRKTLPVKGIQDVIALAKEKPGALNYGSTGIGSGSHLSTELFMARTGIKMTHVPYRGAAPLVQDLMGGTIDIANSTLSSVIAQIQSGDLNGVAIGSPKRNPKLPEVKTLQEQGVTGADASSWTAFFAPAGVPAPARDRLSREIIAALRKPETVAALDKIGFTVAIIEPDQFRAYQVKEIEVWTDIARQAGIKSE
ncbi:tripartite tricarboxylate transporter substrate binding protein [Alsobacter sp. SYSU M60028]|uniref:Tripartite tricarboxylate transporter substrate binding protein n=1 Tax=Alsobacter ponti TaxID=2962936 RepID=A0ABT1LB19_9HYPH|nr:tripartite tricarboxylate transporter substrate binding protein [Alsobacter ponti]MCP8938263.1 tripartite tricarboxylate transporter substrate binding protein [Alsobacter ponti]